MVQPDHDLGVLNAADICVGVQPDVVRRVIGARTWEGQADAGLRAADLADLHRQVGVRTAVAVVAADVDRRVGHRGAAEVARAVLLDDLEAIGRDIDALGRAGAPAIVHDGVVTLRGAAILSADYPCGSYRRLARHHDARQNQDKDDQWGKKPVAKLRRFHCAFSS